MTEPTDFQLLELATPYALHAVSDEERLDIERRLSAAPAPVAAAFDEEVRSVRETMSVVSAATAAQPPAELRQALLAAAEPAQSRRQPRWRTAVFASAAAIAVGLGAPDVQTVSGRLGGGTATVMFSRDRNAGVLVMNNVPPPSPGTVYQMWLVDAKGPTSAGTMGPTAVTPSTKATLTDLGDSTTLAFTVEPGTGSTKPTGTVLAELPLR